MNGFNSIEVTIENVDIEAFGEVDGGAPDGALLKVAGAAPGDRLRVKPVHRSPHRKVIWCDIVEVLSRGPHFRAPICPSAEAAGGPCGGCPAMHLDDETVRAMKIRRVAEALRLSGAIAPKVSFEGAVSPSAYRNRGHFAAARDKKGGPFLGVFAPRNRRIIEIGQCSVLRPSICDAVRSIEERLASSSVPIFPEPSALRYVTLRASRQGEVLADLAVGDSDAAWVHPFARLLLSGPNIVGVSYSVNEETGNALRTRPSVQLEGLKTIVERVGDIDLQLTAASFSQLNADTAAAMYRRAAEMTRGASVLWDLYCGAGGLGLTVLSAQREGAQLFGAEFVEEAVELARLNAANSGARAVFETRNLALGAPPSWPPPEVVLVNPPRRGLDGAVLDGLKTTSAQTIIYMSCDPSSFARDAAVLIKSGFALGEVFAHDMLPMTAHVELIAAFHRAREI